jgi:hypothetical protein
LSSFLSFSRKEKREKKNTRLPYNKKKGKNMGMISNGVGHDIQEREEGKEVAEA